jgi:hypothetical protein
MTTRFDPDQPEKSIDDWFAAKTRQHFAKLEDRQIVPCTLTEWAKWDPERVKRSIADTAELGEITRRLYADFAEIAKHAEPVIKRKLGQTD